MKLRLSFLFLIGALVLALWGCEDQVPGGGPGTTTTTLHLSGTVTDLTTSVPIYNAAVTVTAAGKTNTIQTNANGQFAFQLTRTTTGPVYVQLTIAKHAYLTSNIAFNMNVDTSLAVTLGQDLSTSAIIMGTVRDSTTLFPLRGTSILFAVPGFVDSVITSVDGAFIYTLDLVDRDSMPVIMTFSHAGFQTKQAVYYVHKGTSTNLGNVLLFVDRGSSVGTISGRIFDSQSHLPLLNAQLLLTSSLVTDSLLSAFDGSYLFSINLQGLSSLSGGLKVTKNGYRSQNVSFTVTPGATTYHDIYLDRDTTTGVVQDSGSGIAHSIALVSVSSPEISVYGVGGVESSILTWEVRDSLGFPIDIDHRVTVNFSLNGVPVLGGAYVSPASALTNVSGRVATTLNAGTVSGVVQFVATLTRPSDSAVVTSTPVIITIDAGLPAQAFFSLGPAFYNFAAWDWIGRNDPITVLVGDKYSNPVKKSTAVYFNTTGGVIDASGFTNPDGFASVNLWSGNPLPTDATLNNPALYGNGTGYAHVVAHTLGEGGVQVLDTIMVLFSAHSTVGLSTHSIHVPASGCVDVALKIADRFGNPLAAGTQIAVQATFTPPEGTNWSIIVSGTPTDPLPDVIVRGPGITDYILHICDGTPGGTPQDMPFSVKVSVTGQNGNAFDIVTGVVGP